MREEYNYAVANLSLKADHQFFFYENQLPYHQLDSTIIKPRQTDKLTLIIGNSGSPSNNHLDAVKFLEDNRIQADLWIPVSYGDAHYISFLRKNLRYSYGDVHFADRFMPFEEYVSWLASVDGLVMNSLRPLGYGNILMMMYMDKPVYFNRANISLPDIKRAGLKWRILEDLTAAVPLMVVANREAVKNFLSHERLIKAYRGLFS
jgi:hypothetical protein